MSPFLEYLTSLAQEGETLLLTEQKPTGDTYKDGSPKYVWPAMLPSRWKPGRAMYGNTASYIIDRFIDGKPSAAAANCEYVLVLILDDINTKSKRPPLAPTWRMETSPGNEQWGYVFSEQPSKHLYSAAIMAIAAAGYTDPGAINPVRNFRLPGSINLKPGRDNFESVLLEFNRGLEYTMDEICAALGVTPAEPSSSSPVAINMKDTGSDDVLAWLNERGEVLERANSAGWVGVVCPNHAEHTDGQIGGRYHPVTRSYCCLHSHCTDWTSSRYLEWIEEQGGPAHEPGLRDDLLASTMAPMLAKLASQPRDKFSEAGDAASVTADVEAMEQARQRARLTRDEWFQRFIYVQKSDCYFDIVTKQELTVRSFNATYAHVPCTELVNGKQRPCTPSRWYDINREPRGIPAAVEPVYAPGESSLMYRDGEVYVNRWRDGRRPDRSSVTSPEPWLRHCERVIPDKAEREHVWNVMAYKLQNPGKKINHAILLGGKQGCGKDSVFAPFIRAVCGSGERNLAKLDRDKMLSQFTYHFESEIIVVNELRPDDYKDRRQVENILKPVIAAPPEYLVVNRKGQHPYTALNRTLVIAMSNYIDAIALTHDDRRWFIIWSPAKLMTEAEGKALWTWFLERDGSGFQSVATWLMQRDVSAFNPGAKPTVTEAKERMIEDARSPAEAFVLECIVTRAGPFARGLVGAPIYGIVDQLQALAPPNLKISQQAVYHALAESDWLDLGRIRSKEHGSLKRAYCAPGMIELHTRSAMRNMLEEPTGSILARVK